MHRPGVLQYLLNETRLDAAQLEVIARAVRPAYWKSLCPALTVGTSGSRRPAAAASRNRRRPNVHSGHLATEGYCEMPPLLSPAKIKRMTDAVTTIRNAGWPPVCVFAYDEFWSIWQTPALVDVLSDVLGPGYQLLPSLWCYYVHPTPGAKGWPPHADAFGTPGLSVWIPLTNATLENGCMSVVPKDLVPETMDVGRMMSAKRSPTEWFTHLMQCARPLPARAGSILAWDWDTIHWGGVARRPTTPRISISAEFIGASDPSANSGSSFEFSIGSMPSFRDRLRVIAHCIRRFSVNDAWTFRYQDLGQMLADSLDERA